MRIISGKWKRRKLAFPDRPTLRPTPDRARVTLFNWLNEWIDGARCLDLFAGSGALGFEALSRGAAAVTLIDDDPAVVRALQASAQMLGAIDCSIRRSSAIEFLRGDTGRWDIVFLDPPFASDLLGKCLRILEVSPAIDANSIVYVESQHPRASRPRTLANHQENAHRRRSVSTCHAQRLRCRLLFRYHRALPRGGGNLKTVIYPGTFNPITNGHTDLVNRALSLFDHVVLAIGTSAQKKDSDQLLDRIKLCEKVLAPFGKRVSVERFHGLLVDYANTMGTRFILRGLRTMADFEYEFQMAEMNTELEPSIEYVFLLPSKSCSFISSTLVREIASLGGDVTKFVDPIVAQALKASRAEAEAKR